MATKKNSKKVVNDANVKVPFQNPFVHFPEDKKEFMFRRLTDELKEGHEGESSNKLLLNFYETRCGAKWFRSAAEWTKQGRKIKKGEVPFYLWALEEPTPEEAEKADAEGRTAKARYVPSKVYCLFQTVSEEYITKMKADEAEAFKAAFGSFRD